MELSTGFALANGAKDELRARANCNLKRCFSSFQEMEIKRRECENDKAMEEWDNNRENRIQVCRSAHSHSFFKTYYVKDKCYLFYCFSFALA